MDSTIAEVYANNIQISQLKRIVPVYNWKPEVFEKEREAFLWWLTNPKQGGRFNFTDQVEAWDLYEKIQEPVEWDEDEEFTPSWLEEIEGEIQRAIVYGNYNDYGGQQ